MKIALITDGTVLDYVLSGIKRHSELSVESVSFIDSAKKMTEYNNIRLVPLSQLRPLNNDVIVVAIQNIDRIKDIVSQVVNDNSPDENKTIFIIRPSCLSAKSEFFVNDKFHPDRVIALPFSVAACAILDQNLHNTVHPKEFAKQIYTTDDNINAYGIENVFVNIVSVSGLGTLGIVRASDGKVANSCLNGRMVMCQKLEDVQMSDDNAIHVDEICVLARIWYNNYFHCLTEMCDKILIAEELGFTGQYILYRNADTEKLISLMEISPERIIWIDSNDDGKVFYAARVFEVDGFNIHAQKSMAKLCVACNELAVKLMANDSKNDYPKMLYVPREGRRKLLGVEEVLKKFGFFSFVPEEHSVEEEIKYFYNADVVLCPHGAALVNALFMKEGSALVETCPCNWSASATLSFIIAKSKKLIYRQIIEPANANPAESTGQSRDYYVHNSFLEYTLNEIIDRMKGIIK